jgi:hypothetical protein
VARAHLVLPISVRSNERPTVKAIWLSPHNLVALQDPRRTVTASFCHYVPHFAGVDSARHWTAEHPGTFIISQDDAL